MEMRKVIAPQRDMMASITGGVTEMPGMTDEARGTSGTSTTT